MNWYKLSQQMELFPNFKSKFPHLIKENIDIKDIEEELAQSFINGLKNNIDVIYENELIYFFKKFNIHYEKINLNNQTVYSFNDGKTNYIVFSNNSNLELKNAEQWIYSLSDDEIENYITPRDRNEEFWNSPETVYHGTYEENVDNILKEGLNPADETRGLGNRGTGKAVFTSNSPETAKYYYDIVFEINTMAMKNDGYMPFVDIEGPVKEAELKEALAYKLGLEDFYAEYEQGLDPGTYIFFGPIPAKYLKRIN